MTAKAPSTDVDESKKKTDEGKKEKEIKPEEPRWEVKWHKAFKEQEENFAKTFSDLTKEGVLETLQKKLPDNFKDAKSYDEAMEILRDGKWVERLWHNKDMYERLDLNVKKQEEKEKQKKEVEKKKEELKDEKKDWEKLKQKAEDKNKKTDEKENKKVESKEEKKSEDKNEKSEDKKESGKKPESEKSKEKKSEKKESEKSEDDDIEADKKKEKSEKKWFFWAIGSFLGKTSTQAGNLIRYPFRATRNWLKMAWRSLKYFWFEIFNFPSWGEAMKKIWAKYQEDMKKYAGKFKWNYKKGGK